MAKDKVVLAYSGGLDTTAIIPWLKETYDYDVICACIDVGQESELEGLDERAKYSGASKLYILDVVDDYVMNTSCQPFRQMLYMRINIYSVLLSQDL